MLDINIDPTQLEGDIASIPDGAPILVSLVGYMHRPAENRFVAVGCKLAEVIDFTDVLAAANPREAQAPQWPMQPRPPGIKAQTKQPQGPQP